MVRQPATGGVEPNTGRGLRVSLLTGAADKPYALGLAAALVSEGVFIDFIGSNEVDGPELHDTVQVEFLNLRGDQREDASSLRKAVRVLTYYARLIRYAATAEPRVFHILWNNKFEWIDRTVLLLYYKLLGKGIAFTAHNVNARQRDGNDSWLNRFTLRVQYRLVDHVFVHTERMKQELISEFGVPDGKASVIPFGVNNTLPTTDLTALEAKRQLGLDPRDRTMLFFGNIAPYKGLDLLVAAFAELAKEDKRYRLIIAGRPKACNDYWSQIQQAMTQSGVRDRIIEKIEYVPDEQTEIYFKAADILVLPYTHVFQSGVLFLGYSFGLPVIAADVGSLKEEIIEGRTGFVCKAKDPVDLASTIQRYFESDLFNNLEDRRQEIRDYANERYSWSKVAAVTTNVYAELLKLDATVIN